MLKDYNGTTLDENESKLEGLFMYVAFNYCVNVITLIPRLNRYSIYFNDNYYEYFLII